MTARASRASRSPSAAARTLSLFTGRTDLETDMARDGSRGQELTRSRDHGRPAWHWVDAGWTLNVRGWLPARIDREGDAYVATVRGERGVFPGVIEAAHWAERLT